MSEEFVQVASVSEIQTGTMKKVKYKDMDLMVANVNGQFFALSNKCTHVGGPLAQGKLEGFVVQCPWHGSKFDVRTGEVISSPAQNPVQAFDTKIENGSVLVRKRMK